MDAQLLIAAGALTVSLANAVWQGATQLRLRRIDETRFADEQRRKRCARLAI